MYYIAGSSSFLDPKLRIRLHCRKILLKFCSAAFENKSRKFWYTAHSSDSFIKYCMLRKAFNKILPTFRSAQNKIYNEVTIKNKGDRRIHFWWNIELTVFLLSKASFLFLKIISTKFIVSNQCCLFIIIYQHGISILVRQSCGN